MTGNTKVWRAPLAGLAAVAMLATMGVAASTANAAFKPADANGKYTVTVQAGDQSDGFGSLLANALVMLDQTGSGAEKAQKNDDKKVDVVLDNTDDTAAATEATIYNVPGTNSDGKDDQAFKDLKTALSSNVPAYDKSARTFVAWQLGGVEFDTRADSKFSALSGDITLTARFAARDKQGKSNTSTVKFNGSSDAAAATGYTLVKGDKLAAWQIDTPVDTKMAQQAITGWGIGSGATEAVDLATLDTTKDEIDLYPVWANPSYTVTYNTVTYDANGVGTPAAITGSEQYVAPGKEFTAPDGLVTTVPTGKKLVWATWADADGKDGKVQDSELTAFDFSKGVTADTKLYAKFTDKGVTVTFKYPNKNNSKSDDFDTTNAATYGADSDVAKGSPVSKPADPTDNTGLNRPFLFWATENNANAAYAETASNRASLKSSLEYAWSKNVDAPITLYAVFGEKPKTAETVKFDENWQGGKISKVAKDEDGNVVAPVAPARDGYTFKGWANVADAPADSSDLVDAGTKIYDPSATYYAVWAKAGEDASHVITNDNKTFTDESYAAYRKIYDANYTLERKAEYKTNAKGEYVDENGTPLQDQTNPENGGVVVRYYFVPKLKSGKDEATALKAVAEAQGKLVVKDAEKNTTPVYRVYDQHETKKHLFTTDEGEYTRLLVKGWRDEGVAFYAVTASDFATNNDLLSAKNAGLYTKVYRVYDKPGNRHFYTTVESEYKGLLAKGWRDESSDSLVWYSRTQGGVPVYRAYSPSTYSHLYTLDKGEVDNAVAKFGYRVDKGYEIGFYVEK